MVICITNLKEIKPRPLDAEYVTKIILNPPSPHMKLDCRGYHFSPMRSQQSFFTMATVHDSTSSQLHEINIDGLREVERNQNVE
jgi:hypothetical protein